MTSPPPAGAPALLQPEAGNATPQPPLPPPDRNVFSSFLQGGFECATHRRRDCRRIDVIDLTGHDLHCAEDFRLLASAGIHTVRDGLRWHRIENTPGLYDWTSFLPMLEAAHTTGTQVIWDLCHWGVPHGLDPFSPDFILRFAAFASAAAGLISARRRAHPLPGPALYCPINEISFWSWVGGDLQHFHPYGSQRAAELKQQLVRASAAAIRAIRTVDPNARFVHADPIINICADPEHPEGAPGAARHTASQFEAWDMLAGIQQPELGGDPSLLDIIGVNYYWNNQWIHEGDRTPPGHPLHRPLHRMLEEIWIRYHRPIVITETGSESGSEFGWLSYIFGEVRQALRLGVPVQGVCLYPVMDYPGWDDDRHCACGLISLDEVWQQRQLRADLRDELLHLADSIVLPGASQASAKSEAPLPWL